MNIHSPQGINPAIFLRLSTYAKVKLQLQIFRPSMNSWIDFLQNYKPEYIDIFQVLMKFKYEI